MQQLLQVTTLQKGQKATVNKAIDVNSNNTDKSEDLHEETEAKI